MMAKGTILIIDDDEDIRLAVQLLLESKGYTVEMAATKEEGLDKFSSVKPDLAILDVMMTSWQDGFELARELKKDPDLKNIPILMLTGVEGKTGLEFKSAAGDEEWLPVEGFLDKPVEPEVLLAEVEKLLDK
ncbi:MAG: response regulator [Planctomycetota bacterium]|jgi:CheY-like chemotaxis protein